MRFYLKDKLIFEENRRYSLLCIVFWQESLVKAYSFDKAALGRRLVSIHDVEISMACINGKK